MLTTAVAGATADAQDGDSSERPRIRVRLLVPDSSADGSRSTSVRGTTAADGSFVIPIRRPASTDAYAAPATPVPPTMDGSGPSASLSSRTVDSVPVAPADHRPTSATSERGGSLFDRLVGSGNSDVSGDDLLEPERDGAAIPAAGGAGDDRRATSDPVSSDPTSSDPTSSGPVSADPTRLRSGSEPAQDVRRSRSSDEGAAAVADGSSYRLGPGDTVDVFVWRDPDLSRQVPVRPDGQISLPLVGELQAAGRTPVDLETVITRRLSEYVQRPTVTVTVTEIRSLVIYVVGNVGQPGPQTLEREINVLQAIAMAGGLNEFADEDDIVVVRTLADGTEQRFDFDYSDVVDGKRPEMNVRLRSGDIVYVP